MEFGMGSGLLGLVVFILDIYAIIKIMGSSASSVKKLVWVLIVLFLPVIGLIIWFLMGPK